MHLPLYIRYLYTFSTFSTPALQKFIRLIRYGRARQILRKISTTYLRAAKGINICV